MNQKINGWILGLAICTWVNYAISLMFFLNKIYLPVSLAILSMVLTRLSIQNEKGGVKNG